MHIFLLSDKDATEDTVLYRIKEGLSGNGMCHSNHNKYLIYIGIYSDNEYLRPF